MGDPERRPRFNRGLWYRPELDASAERLAQAGQPATGIDLVQQGPARVHSRFFVRIGLRVEGKGTCVQVGRAYARAVHCIIQRKSGSRVRYAGTLAPPART